MTDELASDVRRAMANLDALVAAGARLKIGDGGDDEPFAAQTQIGTGITQARGYRVHGSTQDMAVLGLGNLLREHGDIAGDQPR